MDPGLGGWRLLSAAVLLLSTDVYSKAPSALQNVNTLPSSPPPHLQSLLNQAEPLEERKRNSIYKKGKLLV